MPPNRQRVPAVPKNYHHCIHVANLYSEIYLRTINMNWEIMDLYEAISGSYLMVVDEYLR